MPRPKKVAPPAAAPALSHTEQVLLVADRFELMAAATPARMMVTYSGKFLAQFLATFIRMCARLDAASPGSADALDGAFLARMQEQATHIEADLVALHARKRGIR
jgi:hypothetical protein